MIKIILTLNELNQIIAALEQSTANIVKNLVDQAQPQIPQQSPPTKQEA
jgi:hypothetical protein